MKTKILSSLLLLATFAGAMSASANLFEITFNAGGISGSGLVDGTANANGSYTVNSGTFTVTGSGALNTPTMTVASGPAVSVFSANGGPGGLPVYSVSFASGLSINYDNLVFPSSNPELDIASGGLAFTFGSGSVAANSSNPYGLAIWSTGPNSYGYYESLPGSPFNFDLHSTGTMTVIPVPEASTYVAGSLMALPFGLSMLRVFRKKGSVKEITHSLILWNKRPGSFRFLSGPRRYN